MGVLVTKAEAAARTAYVSLSRPDLDDARSQSVAPTESDAGTINTRSNRDSLSPANPPSLGRVNDRAPPDESTLSSNRFMGLAKDAETGSTGTRGPRRGEGYKGLEQRRSSSLDSDDIWSEIADAVAGDSSSAIEAFLLPEEEQVRRVSNRGAFYGMGVSTVLQAPSVGKRLPRLSIRV